jgi:hypothetical protein
VNQKRIFKALKCLLLGGFTFWVPSVLLHWLRGNRFSGSDAIGLTIVLPITTVLLFIVGRKISGRVKNRLSEGLFALLGIWLLGPLMMAVSATFSGGGFSKPDGWHFVLIGTGLFPVFTFMMSTYDGTLGAILLTTVLLPLLSVLPVTRDVAPKSSEI